ncbi:hypothetical protein JTB14_023692 [Gonioctena quinquepunctata]|nr:hypothetical protein JTB14_023692 [Gonioctena quinquepunctata]
MDSCKTCQEATESHLKLICCICKGIFCNVCTGLSSSETRRIKAKKSVSWTCTQCESIGSDLNALKAVIMSLQDEVKELKKVAIAPPTSIPPSVFEDFIHEIQERNVRKCNLMIFGISEQESAQSKDDRLIAELNDVSKVINYVNLILIQMSFDLCV